jgi:hypothetical protein
MTYFPLSNVTIQGQTQGGNPTTEIVGTNGNQSLNVCINDPRTAFNEVSVVEPYPLAQIDFVYGINTLVTTSNVQGSNASVTTSGGLLRCTSNGAVRASSCILNAKKYVKYRSGQGAMLRITGLFSYPATGTQQLCGAGFALANTTTYIDFLGFGYGNVSSPTTFSILWRNGRTGVDTWVPQSSWNLDTLLNGSTKSGMTFNPQVLNQFQVQFQSIGDLNFYVENPATGRFIFVHQIPAANYSPFPNFQNPTMQLSWFSNNASSSNTITMYGASGGHFLEGIRNFCGPRGALYSAPSANLVPNVETMIFAIKNATYFGSNTYVSPYTNGVIPCRSQIHLRSFSISSGGYATGGMGPNAFQLSPAPATINIRQIRNPTNSITNWVPYNGINQADADGSNIYGQSTLSSNLSQITGITGGSVGFDVNVACGTSQILDFKDFESVAYPGDVLVFTANVQSLSALVSYVNISLALTWNEDI